MPSAPGTAPGVNHSAHTLYVYAVLAFPFACLVRAAYAARAQLTC